MSTPVCDAICDLLRASACEFRAVEHEPTYTSEQSAKARGEDLRIGGKALLMKTGETFRLFVLSAADRLDSAAIRARFGVKKVRFATPEELKELTGLSPGAVPPFGRPILPFELFLDEAVGVNERIAFNAGSLTNSVIMSMKDYLAVARPEVFRFSAVGSGET